MYLAFMMLQNLVLVPEQVDGFGDVLLTIFGTPLASALLGGMFGALFLPLTLPLTWGAILLLRLASGGPRRAAAAA